MVRPVVCFIALVSAVVDASVASAQSRNNDGSSAARRTAVLAQSRRVNPVIAARAPRTGNTSRTTTNARRTQTVGVLRRNALPRSQSSTHAITHLQTAPGARADYTAIAAANRGDSAAAGAAYFEAAQLHQQAGGPELWAAVTSANSAAQHFERAGDTTRANQAREFAARVQSEIRSTGQTAMPPSHW